MIKKGTNHGAGYFNNPHQKHHHWRPPRWFATSNARKRRSLKLVGKLRIIIARKLRTALFMKIIKVYCRQVAARSKLGCLMIFCRYGRQGCIEDALGVEHKEPAA